MADFLVPLGADRGDAQRGQLGLRVFQCLFVEVGLKEPRHPAFSKIRQDGDNVQLTFTFDFPDVEEGVSEVQSLKFNFDFLSYEFPEFVGVGFNDYVFAYLDSVPPDVPLDEFCNAPVFPPAGCMVNFDAGGSYKLRLST